MAFKGMAQQLTPEARQMKAAYAVYLKHPHASANHLAFIAAFPATKEVFMDIFNDPALDELYEGSTAYIAIFEELSRSYPIQAMPKAVAIGKKLVYSDWQAAGMQRTLMYLAAQHTDSFAVYVNRLPKKERQGVAIFLADTDKPSAEYDALINNLQRAGQAKLAVIFIQAKTERLNRKPLD
jgi:hypothetical protein